MAGNWWAALAACPLRTGTWPPSPGACRWCAAPLTGRRTAWCSNTCEHAFRANHEWGTARDAARRRDQQRCVRCGIVPEQVALEGYEVLTVVRWMAGLQRPRPELWDRQEPHDQWLARHQAAYAPWVTPRDTLDQYLASIALEVNHITPIRGRHAQWGCHHHQDGLETLCRACHLHTTAQQFATRPPTTRQAALWPTR